MPEEIRVSGIDDIFAIFRSSNKELWGDDLNSAWLFRGQMEASWPLLPALWRPDELNNYTFALQKIDQLIEPHLERWAKQSHGNGAASRRYRRETLHTLVRSNVLQRLLVRAFELVGQEIALIEALPEDWGYESMAQWRVDNALDRGFSNEVIALAQHHGVPTFFLDWTRDPLKALWFGTEPVAGETTSCIWALDRRRLADAQDDCTGIEVVLSDRTKNAYLHAQDAVLTQIVGFEPYYEQHGSFPRVEDLADALYPRGILRKYTFTITPEDRAETVRRLWRERKSLPHLMPSLEHCAAFARTLIQIGLFDRRI